MKEATVTDNERAAPASDNAADSGRLVAGFAILHLICCGLPLLLLSGVSLATIVPSWPVIGGVLVLLGIAGFAWYLKRGCATCPRNEGRCQIRNRPTASASQGD